MPAFLCYPSSCGRCSHAEHAGRPAASRPARGRPASRPARPASGGTNLVTTAHQKGLVGNPHQRLVGFYLWRGQQTSDSCQKAERAVQIFGNPFASRESDDFSCPRLQLVQIQRDFTRNKNHLVLQRKRGALDRASRIMHHASHMHIGFCLSLVRKNGKKSKSKSCGKKDIGPELQKASHDWLS